MKIGKTTKIEIEHHLKSKQIKCKQSPPPPVHPRDWLGRQKEIYIGNIRTVLFSSRALATHRRGTDDYGIPKEKRSFYERKRERQRLDIIERALNYHHLAQFVPKQEEGSNRCWSL